MAENISKLNAPSSVYTSENIFEDIVTVNWVKSSNIGNNAVYGYLIHYRTSDNASSWCAWKWLADVPAISDEHSYVPFLPRADYIQYRVCAKSSLGTAYNSNWTLSNISRKNSVPNRVNNFYAIQKQYRNGEDVELCWDSSSDIDDSVKKYEIQISKNYSFWEDFASVTDTSYSFCPDSIGNGEFLKFRIRAVDTNGAKSDFTECKPIQRIDGCEVYVCSENEFKLAQIFVAQNGEFKPANIFICQNNKFLGGV